MFNVAYMLYWCVLVVYPLTFGDVWYEKAFLYGHLLQSVFLFLCIFSYVSKPLKKHASCLVLLGVYGLLSQILDMVFNEVTAIYYLSESLLFFTWAMWLLFRPSYSTAKTINHDNILIAFYKGDNGSFIMNFFSLFGLPVKSMCIIAGDKALFLKRNKETFQFGSSEIVHKNSDNYVIIDSGVAYTQEYISKMKDHSNIVATRGGLRVQCIKAVSDLLSDIGEKFKPRTNIPSLYLRHITE
jgi:hypothetical protein